MVSPKPGFHSGQSRCHDDAPCPGRCGARGGPASAAAVRIEPLGAGVGDSVAQAAELVALDDAVTSLAGEYPRQAEVVGLRYFGGKWERNGRDTQCIS